MGASPVTRGAVRLLDTRHCAHLGAQSLARERVVRGHGARVVVIGDSYSVGLGLRRPQGSWPSRLPGSVHVYGFSGSGFSAHASRCPGVAYGAHAPRALHDDTGLVVIEGGLNDYDQPTAAVRSGFRALVAELHGHRLLVVGPPAAPHSGRPPRLRGRGGGRVPVRSLTGRTALTGEATRA